jgi:hypothetical protein
MTSHQSILSSFESPSTTQSANSYFFEEDENRSDNNNVPVQYQLFEWVKQIIE